MTIRVNTLPSQITDADVIELFSQHGSVQRVEILEGRNAASVKLAGDEEEEAATVALNGREWRGTTLELELVFDDGGRDPGGPPSSGSGSSGNPPQSSSGSGNPPR